MLSGRPTTKTTSPATTASPSTIRSTAAGGRGQGRWKVSSRFFYAVVGRRRFRFRRDFFFFRTFHQFESSVLMLPNFDFDVLSAAHGNGEAHVSPIGIRKRRKRKKEKKEKKETLQRKKNKKKEERKKSRAGLTRTELARGDRRQVFTFHVTSKAKKKRKRKSKLEDEKEEKLSNGKSSSDAANLLIPVIIPPSLVRHG